MQISSAYGKQQEGSKVLPRNQYTAIRDEKPKTKEEAKRPEFKVCKFTTDSIIAEGSDVGTVHKVCANPTCPVNHPKQEKNRDDVKWKAEQEKQRQGASQCQHHGHPRIEGHWGCCPGATHEEVLVIRSEADGSASE